MKMSPEILRDKIFTEQLMFLSGCMSPDYISEMGKAILKSMTGMTCEGTTEELSKSTSMVVMGSLLATKTKPYCINEKLIDALYRKSDINLKIKYIINRIGENEPMLLEMPYRHRTENAAGPGYSKTVAVFYSKKWSLCPESSLIMLLPNYDRSTHVLLARPIGNLFSFNLTAMHFPIPSGEHTVDEILSIPHQGFPVPPEKKIFVNKVVKSMLYILSGGNPDLREIKPVPVETKKPKKLARLFRDSHIYPRIAVGMGFEKSPLYVKDQWEYLRWQPYGPRTDPNYKLIKIVANRRKPLAKPQEAC